MRDTILIDGIELRGEMKAGYSDILTTGALKFVRTLERRFGAERNRLLALREQRQADIDRGQLPDFLPDTEAIRRGEWTIGPVPEDLQDRRVEITGPSSDRKMVINALNSGAKTYMADFEDANSPTWENTINGQINVRDAIRGTIRYTSPDGRLYTLIEKPATLLVRPRGWHLEEKHVHVDGEPMSGSLFDFGLFFYHNAQTLIDKNSGPYFYLPKLESRLEARLWNEVFTFAQAELGIAHGTIKATVLIETILAAFEMDEILFELRDHAAGLNCGRWDYIFSYIKKLRRQPDVILPDRGKVTMESPFMRAYSLLAIQTCHRRRAWCIGGMAAQIPVKGDPEASENAMAKVRADKLREVRDGHDGTWVAHPALVPVAKEVFDEWMKTPNQIDKQLTEVNITASDLLEVPKGSITEEGVRLNVSVGIQYLAAWLQGYGAVPIRHLMEDAATAEISRTQLWQWIRHPRGITADGRHITAEWVGELVEEETNKIENGTAANKLDSNAIVLAAKLFREMTVADELTEFLTIPGYRFLS